eukprot:5663119-Amphidinium_carterae.1
MASKMKEPREGYWARVQLRHPCLVAVYPPQPATDDRAGELLRLHHWCIHDARWALPEGATWQSTVALSLGESEYYTIVKAAAQGLHTATI